MILLPELVYVRSSGDEGSLISKKHHKPAAIDAKLRYVEVPVSQGMARIDAIREISVTGQSCARWRKQYGGIGTDQFNALRRLQ